MGRVILVVAVGSYKPDGIRNHFLVGLISTLLLPISGDVARGGTSDRDRSAPIEWTRGPQIKSRSRAFLKVITAQILLTWQKRRRRIEMTRRSRALIA